MINNIKKIRKNKEKNKQTTNKKITEKQKLLNNQREENRTTSESLRNQQISSYVPDISVRS
mgnify:CR=1 FL=1